MDTDVQNSIIIRIEQQISPILKSKCASARDVGDFEDIYQECVLEIVKCVRMYAATKPYDELIKLSVTMCTNRIYDMRSALYSTHRVHGLDAYSIDIDEDDGDGTYNYHQVQLACEDMYTFELFEGLSSDAAELLQEVIHPSERGMFHFMLQQGRKAATNVRGLHSYKITPVVMCRALGWTLERTKSAWEELHTYRS